MTHYDIAVPVNRKLLTPGVTVLLVLMGLGLVAGVYRFLFGLAHSTNLSQQYPWGLWIIADVSFIALAAGGFTTAAIAHVFHREAFHALARPALVTALLGYTCACIALAADLGKYYNIWHPLLPSMWQGNSALFEVGMCVMCYLAVLYIEYVPVLCERFIDDLRYPGLGRLCARVNRVVGKTMFVVIVLGVGISCLHQSSLGQVMALVPTKLHPLWYTPILALLFLVSAIAVGFPTVIFVCITASWGLKLRTPVHVLAALAKYVPVLLSFYLAFKFGDMLIRRSYLHLADDALITTMFLIEMVPCLIIPLVMTATRRVRSSPKWLWTACLLAWIGYRPPFAMRMYVPSLAEWMLTIGVVATLVFVWRLIVIYFPVLSFPGRAKLA
jgi:Ni/Fe-hydrogenase subunit HybB-like protein